MGDAQLLNAANRKRTRRNAIKPNSAESLLLYEFSVQHRMGEINIEARPEVDEPAKRAREEPPVPSAQASSESRRAADLLPAEESKSAASPSSESSEPCSETIPASSDSILVESIELIVHDDQE